MTTETTQAPSIAARLDRLPMTRLHFAAVGVIGLGLFFDQYENFLAATIATVLKKDFALGQDELKVLLASAFIGQFIGALFMGRLADRYGRRTAFMINLALYSAMSLAGAFSPNAAFLVVTRFVAGIGIGGEFALADSYLSDILPKNVRGKYISLAYVVSFLGVPVVGFAARWLTPQAFDLGGVEVQGWRLLFVFGALGSLLVWLVRRGLPESPRWLEAQGRYDEADAIVRRMEAQAVKEGNVLAEPDAALRPVRSHAITIRALFRPPYRRRTVMLWIVSALEVFGYYGFGTIAPLVLLAKGYSIQTSLLFVALSYIGYPLGAALAVPIVERIERRYLVIGSAGLMAVFGLWFGFAASPVQIVLAGFLYTVSSNLFSNAYHVYLADSYPTAIRGTAAGAAYSLSKLVTAFLPFVLLPILDERGSVWVFAVVAAAMLALMITVAALGHRSTGRSADEV
ncbi:MFS transporter [Tsukamurella ocularis]|uniref:MFS transporter n=1 Tax=Tsukamurella ocularis TaxID=1970234 RepID=UPI00216943FC|nr:MFS transporter [Tsukamurella ocularis]MCS3780383.1 putative MFS transporter [Tsukamurella ocularis]MCS3786062.1 putative MFS transporter [Tsukamurella ocularis]MCS3849426.1 putative MFS transporter [Tsukamurella ocularis]